MHAALGWLLAAAALLLWPTARRDAAARHGRRRASGSQASPAATDGPRRMSSSALSSVAAAGVVVSAVTVLGPATGAVAAMIGCPLVVFFVRRLPSDQKRRGLPVALPLALDLAAAALRAGQPPDTALTLAATAAGSPLTADLLRVAGLLRLGAEPEEAWRVVAERAELESVAAAARRSSSSGIRLASAFEDAAAELRDRIRAAAGARAARSGVAAMGPLALCFLPAFVCVGIVPAVVGIASGVLTTLP
jgi:Flp pilus assembly protein TadB